MEPNNGVSDSVGRILREERERQGLCFADVHSATKISSDNLAALEDERFDIFPNRVYARAFLRDYANFLDLDSGPLLEIYEHNWAGRELHPAPTANRQHAGASNPITYWFAFFLLLAAVAVAIRNPIIDAFRQAIRPRPVPVHTHKPAAPPPPARPLSSPDIPEQPAAPQGLELTVAAVRPAWIRVHTDAQMVFQNTMRTGQQMTWRATTSIAYRIGDAGAVRLTLNGKPLPPAGPSGQIANGKFTAPSPAATDAPPGTPSSETPP